VDNETPEIELNPTAASVVITVAQCQSMYRQYRLATPVSGTATSVRAAREFQRFAFLTAAAVQR
jgi:hypothetical protein